MDLISRQAAIDAIRKHELVDLDEKRRWYNHGLMDAEIAILDVPSAQPEDWMERNKERILQAGIEGREIEFRIGGRLFAIREKAQ